MTTLDSKSNSIVIDARGPRFSASITVLLLSAALATQSLTLIIIQSLVFLIGATRGPQFTPYGLIFKNLVKPRLNGDFIPEDVRPPQFAQSVGFIFTVVAIVGLVTGANSLFLIATSIALAAAFLNAAFNYCLGCEVYLLLLRARRS